MSPVSSSLEPYAFRLVVERSSIFRGFAADCLLESSQQLERFSVDSGCFYRRSRSVHNSYTITNRVDYIFILYNTRAFRFDLRVLDETALYNYKALRLSASR